MAERKDEIIAMQMEIIRAMTERNLRGVADDLDELAWSVWDGTVIYSGGERRSRRVTLLGEWGLYTEGMTLRDAPAAYTD